MIKQPEALLAFADRIEEAQGKPIAIDPQAAVELRRLHALNQELLEALKVAVCEIADWGSYASEYFQNKHDLQGAISRLNAIIAKTTGEQA